MDKSTLIKTAKHLGINVKGLSLEQIYAMVEEQGRQDAKAESVNGGLNKMNFMRGLAPYLASKGYGVEERNAIIDKEWDRVVGKKN